MPVLFRIETDQTELNWVDQEPRSDSGPPAGRLAISFPNQANKTIRIQRHGVADDIANRLDIAIGPCLFEETSYDFHLQSKAQCQLEIRHHDPTILEGLYVTSNGMIFGKVNFKSRLGQSRFTILVDGKAEYDFEVEVFPSKLDYAADYDVIVADVQQIMTGLVLEYLRSTFQLGFATETEESSKLEWLLLLRHVIDDLERGLRYIEQHPQHSLTRERVSTRVEKVRRPDATIIKAISHGKSRGPKANMASGLVLPARLPERRARITWDTPEHRWLASQLDWIRRSLVEIRLAERKRRSQNKVRHLRTLEEIASFEKRIAALQSLSPLSQAKGSAPPGFSSLRLQEGPGYRDAYQACLILLQGLRVDGGPVGLSVKDLHYLYEYWCYLTLVGLVAKITGEKVPVRQLLYVENKGLKVRLKRGTAQTVNFSKGSIQLTYNPQYKGDAFIMPQKPDIVLTFRYPHLAPMRLVFDAKYRITTNANYVKQYGSPGPPQDAIDSLHRYRDAILEETGSDGPRSEKVKKTVVEGVALFPYADLEDRFRSSDFWVKLERGGIGAIPFLPRETRYLEEWLRKALKRGAWSTAERAISYESLEQVRAWQRAEKDRVLIAVLKRDVQKRLKSIKLTRRYCTPLVGDGRQQFLARQVAFYSPAAGITHRAAVKNIELRQQQVVYALGEMKKLEKAIEDRGPERLSKRFSQNRWTSRLGIEMASELREVFLDASAEWRLYEQLGIARIDFTLVPDTRTWFVTKRARVRYEKAAGFVIRRKGVRDEYKTYVTEVVERLANLTRTAATALRY